MWHVISLYKWPAEANSERAATHTLRDALNRRSRRTSHTAPKKALLHESKKILFFYILRQAFFSKGVSFRCERCKLLTRDYPLLEFGQRHFSRKNITLALPLFSLILPRAGNSLSKCRQGKKRHRARIFAGCKRIYILHQCTRAECVCDWLPAPRNAINVWCTSSCLLRRNDQQRERDAHSPKEAASGVSRLSALSLYINCKCVCTFIQRHYKRIYNGQSVCMYACT